MGWISGFYRSTIGRKVVMAATGALLVVFVIGHVGGNLLVYRGPDALNDWSHFLQSNAIILWSVRVALVLATLLHVHSAWTLTRAARAARPVGYARRETLIAGLASRTMRWGGVLLLLFIVFHILHLTTGGLHPDFAPGDPYYNVVTGLSVPAVAAFYIAAMIALGLHLRHGIWSAFQTLGANHPRLERARLRLATAIAVVVAGGFLAIPVGVLLGWIR